MVLGCEVGERWSEEARNFVSQLAKAKSRREQSTQTAGETRLVPPLEHFTAARLGLSPCPSWNVEGGLGSMGTHRLPRLCSKSSDRSVGVGAVRVLV